MGAEWAKLISLGSRIGKGVWNNPLVAQGRRMAKKAILGGNDKTKATPKPKNKPVNKAPTSPKNTIAKPEQNPAVSKPKKQSLRFDTTTTPTLTPSAPTTYSPVQRQNRKKLQAMGFTSAANNVNTQK